MTGEAPVTAARGVAFDPAAGVIRLTRVHLAHLVAVEDGAPAPALASDGDGARVATPSSADTGEELRRLGAVDARGLHPALTPVLDVLRRPTARFFLRRWRGVRRPLLEGVVGPAGIVVLPGGADHHAAQQVHHHHPRTSALARVLAGLMELGPTSAVPSLPEKALSWDDLRAVASTSPPRWVADLDGEPGTASLADLVWQAPVDGPRGSVVLLVDLGAAGVAEAVAVDRADSSRGYRLVGRRPEEVWLGLCRLAATVAS